MAKREIFLGLDVGTQGVKGALVDVRGKILAQQYLEHKTIYPRPDWCEQDMVTNWWHNPVAVIQALLDQEPGAQDRVAAVSVSGLYPALGPTDGQGRPLRNAILYSDNRSVQEVREVNQILGLQLTSEELTPKLIWFLRHEPELAARTEMFFDAAHYLVYKLSGAYVTDTVTTGLYGAIYQSPTASWREEVCLRFGIPVEILPEVHPPATIVGEVTPAASTETGLRAGTPVLAGMPDLVASLLSVGAVHTSETAAYYGTAGLVPVLKDEMLNAAFRPYPVEERGRTPQDGYMFDYPVYCLTVGDAVRWFRDQFGTWEKEQARQGGQPSAYAMLDRLAQVVPAGAEGLIFLPYLQGQRSPDFNPWASGVFFGLRTAHTRGHLFRAVLESFGYAIRHGLETMYPAGHPIQRLVATGGGARSALWRQIVSDITGLSQEYVPEADGPLGAAYMAGLALGWFSDFSVLQQEWVRVADVTEPYSGSQEEIERNYTLFVELHDGLTPYFTRQRSLREARAVLN